MNEILHFSDFAPFLDHSFQISFTPEISIPAILIMAKEFDSYSPADRKPFSLIFRTDQKKEYFPQAIRILHHPEKGEISVFLVPLGPDQLGMRYEAIFS
jgi:hypothetical protein